MKMSLRFWHRWLNNHFKSRHISRTSKRRLGLQALEDRSVPATLFGLTENNQILRFDSANPNAAIQISVSGLGATEKLTSIDFRPATEKLYAISDFNSSLYTINTTTGAATLVGAAGFTPVATRFGIDFNPQVDRIRFVSNSGNNIRIDPNTGAVASFDPGLNGATTSLVEVAYTNNFAGTMSTKLFGIDSTTDSLYEVTSPNNGTTALVGALGVNTDDRVGFDVALDDGLAYATFTLAGVATLHTVDLATGAAVSLGTIGVGTPLIGLTAAPLGNAPPIVTFSGVIQTYDTEADTPIPVDPAATLTDPDSADFGGGSLVVSQAVLHANDLLSIRSNGSVSVSGNKVLFNGIEVGTFTTGDGFTTPLTVTFNSSATPAAAQAILRNVVFSTTDDPMTGPRQLTATVNDGDGGVGVSGQQQVNLADLTAPTVDSITRLDPSPTNETLVNFTVTFSEDVMGVDVTDFVVTSTGSIAGTSVKSVTMIDAKTYQVEVENLTGEGTVRLDLADDDSIVDAAGNKLGGVGDNGDFTTGEAYVIDRTFPIVIIDQQNGQDDPAFAEPVRFFVSFSEPMFGFDASDVMVSGTAGATNVTITDLKNGNYEVEVSGATQDGTIIINIDAAVAMDAAGNENEAATIFDNQVTVNLVNDAPVITGPAAPVAATEDMNFTFDNANLITITDSDLNDGELKVTITATNGTFTLSDINGLNFTTGDGVDDATMTFTGKQFDINVALKDLLFSPTPDFFGAATLEISADDQGQTGSGGPQVGTTTITLDVAGINDGPVATINPGKLDIIVVEDTTFNFPNTFITFTDADAGTDAVQVTISVGHGTLTISDVSKLTFSEGDGTGDAKMVFTGSIADINDALSMLSYLTDANFSGFDTITVNIDDQGHNGTGGPLTDTETLEFAITAVNDAPVVTVPAAQAVDEDVDLVFTGPNLISISDVDAGSNAIKVSLTSTNGLITLSKTTGLTFTSGDGTGDSSMTFTGTLVDINAALDGLKYKGNANFNGAASIKVDVDDQGFVGTGGALTDSETVSITVNAVNDAPIGVADKFTTNQNQVLTVNAPGVLGNDSDPEGTTLKAILITDVPAAAGKLTLNENGSFKFTPNANFTGNTTFQYKASDGGNVSDMVTVTITVNENRTTLFAVGAGAGAAPQVVVHNEDGSVRFSFLAFDAAFTGGVAVATGDVNGDGVDDVVVGAGAGGAPHIRVISGADQGQIHSFMAFDPAFSGGVNVAVGDVNGDGFGDVIVGAGAGGSPHVVAYDGRNGSLLQSFFAYDPLFAGGVSVSSRDFNNDGRDDIVTGAGAGGGPHVMVYAGLSGQVLSSFFAFDPLFSGGVNVAAGNFNTSSVANQPNLQPAIFAAAGAGGVPVVSVFSGGGASQHVASFFAFEEEETNGARIGAETKANGSSLIYLGAGPNNEPTVRVVDANTLGDVQNFNAFDPAFQGGVFIG